jgi:hypothetical protein
VHGYMIVVHVRTANVHVSLVIGALKRRSRFGSSYYEWSIIVAGSFYFYFYLFFTLFLAVCILNVLTSSGCYVGAEAGCNCYLLDINIFPLSKKKLKSPKCYKIRTLSNSY